MTGKTFDLTSLNFRGQSFSARLVEGELWFLAADVYAYLFGRRTGISARKFLTATDMMTVTRQSAPDALRSCFKGQVPSLSFLNESGLYKLILRSDKPGAREFQDWVTKEVLPRIRANGGYVKDEEKVATGEITAQQAEANLWKFFAARIAELDAIAGPIRKDAANIQEERLALIEEQRGRPTILVS